MSSRPAPRRGAALTNGSARRRCLKAPRGGGGANGRRGRARRACPVMAHKQIYYSDKYDDEEFEYRHVMLPKDIAKLVPKTHLLSESEWRNLGVQQSQGWVHYMIHEPGEPRGEAGSAQAARPDPLFCPAEPHILLFRRPLPKKPEK
ncbi:cyclin-dependent kinases regulatory subunit 1 isoform X1 [Molothrus aeneus]